MQPTHKSTTTPTLRKMHTLVEANKRMAEAREQIDREKTDREEEE